VRVVRKLIVNEFMTLDGVVQGHGDADEDASGGFSHGGWHLPYFDAISWGWQVRHLSQAGGLLLGRRTYDILAGYWPTAPQEERDLADILNTLPKHVVSRTLVEPLTWNNAALLHGELVPAVRALKQEHGNDLHVLGSADLVTQLIDHDLVDAYRLMIDPVLVGGGKRIFRDGATPRHLSLHSTQITPSGAVVVTYTSHPTGQAPD
jgi:dihydrofolate reductase